MTESSLLNLLAIMAQLRDRDGGCPWDLEQTHNSLLVYFLEETYEVFEAVEKQDMVALRDELGDVLFQIIFHSRIAEESGYFKFDDVVVAISEKLRRRHPHVFASETVGSVAEQSQRWEELKASERQEKKAFESAAEAPCSVLDGVAVALPAMMRSIKLQQRAAHVGFDWTEVEQVLAKVEEELNEVKEELGVPGRESYLEHEIGDLLMAVTNLARHVAIDPETALRKANQRFEQRFKLMEQQAAEDGRPLGVMSSAELELLWEQAKKKAC